MGTLDYIQVTFSGDIEEFVESESNVDANPICTISVQESEKCKTLINRHIDSERNSGQKMVNLHRLKLRFG